MKVLALSGSLRAASLNTLLLRTIGRAAPPAIDVRLYDEIGELPLFNPDLEAEDPPVVARLRTQIIAADALIIASPEYAHGISGVMKNALDWMVGNEAFVHKPVALLNAAPRATHAYAALKEIINVMSARIIEEASITIPISGSTLDEESLLMQPAFVAVLHRSLSALQQAVMRLQAEDAAN